MSREGGDMRRTLRVLVPLLLMVFVMAAPASATIWPDQARIGGWETGYVPGPDIPDGRCPAGAMWMLLTAGTGELNSYGTFSWTAEHCSWVVAPSAAGAEGALGAGEMVLTFDGSGDQLFLAYEGKWRFVGDLTTGEGVAEVRQAFDVAGGTGMFEGATGYGSIDGTLYFHEIYFRLVGDIELDD